MVQSRRALVELPRSLQLHLYQVDDHGDEGEAEDDVAKHEEEQARILRGQVAQVGKPYQPYESQKDEKKQKLEYAPHAGLAFCAPACAPLPPPAGPMLSPSSRATCHFSIW